MSKKKNEENIQMTDKQIEAIINRDKPQPIFYDLLGKLTAILVYAVVVLGLVWLVKLLIEAIF